MIDALVTDLLETSRAALEHAAPASINDVRRAPAPLIRQSAAFHEIQLTLKRFLREHLYTHPHVQQMTQRAHDTIELLFEHYFSDLARLPPSYADAAREAADAHGTSAAARVVADYIAGMTDRFALRAREEIA